MSEHVQRGRGRPAGSGKPDDPTLRQVAELLAEDPGLTTTAIKQLIGTKNSSDIRRLQVKWKAKGLTLRRQARERRERQRGSVYEMLAPRATGWSARPESPSVRVFEAHARLAELFKPWRAMQAWVDAMRPSPAMQAWVDAMRPLRERQALIDDATRPLRAMQVAIDEANRWSRHFERLPMFEASTRRGMI